MTAEYEKYLAHYGVKGMKWGFRRYQNEDGSLTEEGKARRLSLKPESDTWKKNEAKRLSDDELRRRNNRMAAEAQYRQNIENRHPISKETKSALKKIFIYSAIGVAAATMAVKYKGMISKGEDRIKQQKEARKMMHDMAAKNARQRARRAYENSINSIW